jgi:hypothetical protein
LETNINLNKASSTGIQMGKNSPISNTINYDKNFKMDFFNKLLIFKWCRNEKVKKKWIFYNHILDMIKEKFSFKYFVKLEDTINSVKYINNTVNIDEQGLGFNHELKEDFVKNDKFKF